MPTKILLSLVLGFNLTLAHSLEIDEKLTLRFLKVSATKKTVLINRGGEDGLVVGDHAKFFITAGVVARGVAEKVSPSRSIWSLYRIVDPNEITDDKVLNLKIATPVKITEDASKSMKEEVIPGGSESMSMNDAKSEDNSSNDNSNKEIVIDEADQSELESMGIDADEVAETKKPKAKSTAKTPVQTTQTVDYPTSGAVNKTDVWEVWGTMYLNSLSGTTETGTTSTDTTSSTFDISAGVERYFHNTNGFFKDVSLTLLLHKRITEAGSEVTTTSDWLEYGLGVSYHFYNRSYDINRPILFGSLTFGKGSSTNETTLASGASQPVTEEGDSTFWALGLGTKYLLSNGIGARVILDYYSSTETYSFSDETESERSLSGPRLHFGISYRF